MATALNKKKNKSSLDIKYVDKFVKEIETKLYNYNLMFLTPYKKELDELDSSVLSKISKNFNLPTLIIKNALDELWNHHWILGQQDVLSSGKRSSNYSMESNELVTFSIDPNQKIADSTVEKTILKRQSKRVAVLQKELNKELSSKNPNQGNRDTIKASLDLVNNELQQFLGSLGSRNVTQDKRNKQFASIDVRVRDLQETIKTMELKLSESNSSNSNGIDVLNSTEFGTIYQNKRTLLLAQNYSEDYKKNVVKKVQQYFVSNSGVRPSNREQKLFNALTTPKENSDQAYYQNLLKNPDLKNEDRTALTAIEDFIDGIKGSKSLNDKQIQTFATGESGYGNDAKVNLAITRLKNQTAKSDLYKDLAQQLIDLVKPYQDNKKVARYKESVPKVRNYSEIKNLLKTIKNRETNNILVNGKYVEGVYDKQKSEYKPIEAIENAASNIFGIRRIKRIAETEISLAYNLGRLKKLEEMGYKKVRVTNEAENRSNRDKVLALEEIKKVKESYRLGKAYRLENKEEYMPILCDHCLSRTQGNSVIFDIKLDKVYESNVNTPYSEVDSRYSKFPPFHVSCWCYFVGVEESSKEPSLLSEVAETIKNTVVADSLSKQNTSENTFYNDPFIKKLVIAGVGLLGVGTAYYAYSKLIKNRVQLPLKTLNPKKTNTLLSTTRVAGELAEENQQATLKGFVDNLDDTAMVEVAQNASKLPLSPVTRSASTDLISSVDLLLFTKAFLLSNTTEATLNSLISENPEYLAVLNSLLKSKRSYEEIRSQILSGKAKTNLDDVYREYLESKQNYESQLREYLKVTKDKKSSIADLNAQLNLSAKETLLANRQNLPEGTSLETALENLKSRQAIESSKIQLKSIEKNLSKELNSIENLQSKESKLIDSRLGGRDTQTRAEQLKNFDTKIPSIAKSSKNLDSVVNNINKIKQDLNSTQLNIDTIRSISKKRLDSSSITDRALLLDTQRTYMKQIMSEKEKVVSQLKTLSNTENLENFSKLYRSEISNKAKTNYKYSQNVWSNADITKLDSTYKDVSNVLTVKKSYESYLLELDEMLDKMNNFERTIDSNIQFSFNDKLKRIKLNY